MVIKIKKIKIQDDLYLIKNIFLMEQIPFIQIILLVKIHPILILLYYLDQL